MIVELTDKYKTAVTIKCIMRKMGDDDPPSLEYIEDPYFPKTDTTTPSLDDDEIVEFDHRSLYDDCDMQQEWSPETELYIRSLPLDQIFSIADDQDDYQKVEADLAYTNRNCDSKQTGRQIRILGKLFNRQSMRDVKVTFIDFSKPYLAKISSNDNYKSFLNIGNRGRVDLLVLRPIAFHICVVCHFETFHRRSLHSP